MRPGSRGGNIANRSKNSRTNLSSAWGEGSSSSARQKPQQPSSVTAGNGGSLGVHKIDKHETVPSSVSSDHEWEQYEAFELNAGLEDLPLHDARMASAPLPAAANTNNDGSQAKHTVSNSTEKSKNLPEACLFVASLSSAHSDVELQESVQSHFLQWGNLTNVKVLKDWLARPYAFVQFEDPIDAQNALLRAHNTVVNGRYIRVEQAKVNRTLFIAKVGAIPLDELTAQLEEFGPVESIKILQNFQTGRSKGCGFVKFRFREDAINAFMGVRQRYPWVIEWATNIDETKPELDLCSIFVGQLNQFLVTPELVHQKFAVYGEITSLQVVNRLNEPGPTSRPAFAFITFADDASAENAIEYENGQMWLEKTIRVQYRQIGEHKGIARIAGRRHSIPPNPDPPPHTYINPQHDSVPSRPPPPPKSYGHATSRPPFSQRGQGPKPRGGGSRSRNHNDFQHFHPQVTGLTYPRPQMYSYTHSQSTQTRSYVQFQPSSGSFNPSAPGFTPSGTYPYPSPQQVYDSDAARFPSHPQGPPYFTYGTGHPLQVQNTQEVALETNSHEPYEEDLMARAGSPWPGQRMPSQRRFWPRKRESIESSSVLFGDWDVVPPRDFDENEEEDDELEVRSSVL
ncbi:hypothetical protein BC830DRAFT_1221930 [Chytriomyces sp. MP71]|nr:hypothetical protein BC830DRAFT_1221930 [Chytriomyces sp. MP71]